MKVELRSLALSDKPALAVLANNLKIYDNVRDVFPFPYTEKDALTFLRSKIDEDPVCTFSINYNGKFVGVIGIERQTDIHRFSAEIGYWLGEPFWGLGIASEAVKQLAELAFSYLEVSRLFAGVFSGNRSSCRVLEKAGFNLECIAEKAAFKNGIFIDEHRYALVRKP